MFPLGPWEARAVYLHGRRKGCCVLSRLQMRRPSQLWVGSRPHLELARAALLRRSVCDSNAIRGYEGRSKATPRSRSETKPSPATIR